MKERIKQLVLGTELAILRRFPAIDVIIFESVPDCAGNTGPVFEELIRRDMNKKYKFVWWIHESSPEDHPKIENVTYLRDGAKLMKYQQRAKLLVSENYYQPRQRDKGQYSLHMLHAGSVKKIDEDYYMPEGIDEVITLSPMLTEYDAENNHYDVRKTNPLGFPRNDVLLGPERDVHTLFTEQDYDRLIYWMPTYRQHKNASAIHSSITIPFMDHETDAQIVNAVARETNVLIVIKPHFAQDTARIRSLNLSNIQLIDDQYLKDRHWRNYELLRCADALISDYSSVYYDFMLTDRPIGLCWIDYDEYEKREGFAVDMKEMMAGGEKILSIEDMCSFIRRIASHEDLNRNLRQQMKTRIFPFSDLRSTERVADRIEAILQNMH